METHLAFKIAVGRHLIEDVLQKRGRKGRLPRRVPRRPALTHAHFRSSSKRKCIVCGHKQRWYCPACGHKWMCREGCYYDHHCLVNERYFDHLTIALPLFVPQGFQGQRRWTYLNWDANMAFDREVSEQKGGNFQSQRRRHCDFYVTSTMKERNMGTSKAVWPRVFSVLPTPYCMLQP